MPFIYQSATKQINENYQTSGSANTEIDFLFLKPGATRPLTITALRVQGKGAGLTTLSGISIRLKQWTGTSSTGGTATTPSPKNALSPACVATAAMGTGGGTGAVTSGNGGPLMVGYASMGASGPGGMVPINPDDSPVLDGGSARSMDLFSSSPTASLNFEATIDNQEG